jgi:hypothetical protein
MPSLQEFASLDRHAFRVACGVLLDVPLAADRDSHKWVATIWRDDSIDAGWARLLWERHPTNRGWVVHPLTHVGDVVEFGADTESALDRWYGYVTEIGPLRLILVGPFETPNEAASDACVAVTQWRRL